MDRTKLAQGYDAVDSVASPMATTASSASKSGITGAGIGSVAGLVIAHKLKANKLQGAGIGSLVGGTLGAVSGVGKANQQRHMALQQMGLEPIKAASLQHVAELGRQFALSQVEGLSPAEKIAFVEKQANAFSDGFVKTMQGFDKHILGNVGHLTAATFRGAGHLGKTVANLDLQGKLHKGGDWLVDYAKDGGPMNRQVWGRTAAGIGGGIAAVQYGRQKAEENLISAQQQQQGLVPYGYPG